MGRVIFLIFFAVFSIGGELDRCDSCHLQKAPPFNVIYRKYLVIYSSKRRIEENMVNFLTDPSKQKGVFPKEAKKIFFPKEHPLYDKKEAKEAVRELIEREDLLKKVRVTKPRE